MNSTIRLFKGIPIKEKGKKTDKTLLKETIKRGFIFSPEVVFNYSQKELFNLIDTVEKEVGLSVDKMNSSFHKSWKKVKETDIEELVLEQIVHYITTYGFESVGIYNKETVYIPPEELKIPKLNVKEIPLIVIKGYTKEEIKSKLLKLLESGIALSEDTKKDVIDIATFLDIQENEIAGIKNKEVRVALYDYLDIFPENNIEFLRFLIYKSTNKTLLIKNPATINEIKSKDNLNTLNLLLKYEKKYGFDKLSEIFYRFKPLFLAFRTNKKLKTIINKIRKLAIQHHKPMPEDYLNNITSLIKWNKIIDKDRLKNELDRVNIFRKIRLAYALNFRTEDTDSILYKIRNGKSYATDFSFSKQDEAKRVLKIVLNSIIKDIKPNVEGKKIYIPSWIHYSLPATEKQFTGYFPSGTYVSIPKDMVFGIHWENLKNDRVDLDLSLINTEGDKIGWDGSYRNENKTILFSGDITDAPKSKGASELFFVNKQSNTSGILFVNYFNYTPTEVPFSIVVAKELVKDFKRNYMVNPNNVLCVAKSKITEKQKILGLLISNDDENKFYFTETHIGVSITSYSGGYGDKARDYLVNFYNNMIELNDILEKAGANLVSDKNKCDIDLSPENLEKDSILNLIMKNST